MSEIEKTQEKLIQKTEELKEITKEANQEKDPVVRKGLMERLEEIAEDLAIIKAKWKGFQEQVQKEEEEKIARREKHEKEVEVQK
jgi:hypothetical protein